jgi:secreted trypsin-like serine protease
MGAGIRRKVKDVVAAVPETETESRKIGCHLGKEFAAGGQGIDTCNGDSGGPVFAREKDGKWVLVGTTSRATRVQTIDGNAVIGNEPLSPCGDGGIYTLCWKHPWLRETIKKLQQP